MNDVLEDVAYQNYIKAKRILFVLRKCEYEIQDTDYLTKLIKTNNLILIKNYILNNKPLQKETVSQLRKLAAKYKIEDYNLLRKQDLINAISRKLRKTH